MRVFTKEHRKKLSKAHKGRKRNIAHCEAIRRSLTGRKITWGNKISKAWENVKKGPLSQEHKYNIAKGLVAFYDKKGRSDVKLPRPYSFYKIRPFILKRDNYKCQDCRTGSKEKDKLTIHHKDRDRMNSDPENLVTLHNSCHTVRHWKEGKYHASRH